MHLYGGIFGYLKGLMSLFKIRGTGLALYLVVGSIASGKYHLTP
jgi:hypothetical protein